MYATIKKPGGGGGHVEIDQTAASVESGAAFFAQIETAECHFACSTLFNY
jgi:hypothetical protein